jgi:AcrR family transcriptional regulator
MKRSVSQETAKRILNATLKLFVKKGFHGTTISDISNATKFTEGGIYFHFENKYDFLKKILEEYEKNYLDKMIEEVEAQRGKAVDKMAHFLRLTQNFASKNRELCLCLPNLATELCSINKRYERDIKRIYDKHMKFFINLIEEGKKDGSFRDVNSRIVALHLIGSNEGNLLMWNMYRKEIDSEDFSKSYMRFFLNGICKPT